MELKDIGSMVLLGFGTLGGLSLGVGATWFWFRKGFKEAGIVALTEVSNLANTRKEQIEQLEKDKARLMKEKGEVTEKLNTTESLLNDCARQNLRLHARIGKMEQCINNLERELGWTPTPFDDVKLQRPDTEH